MSIVEMTDEEVVLFIENAQKIVSGDKDPSPETLLPDDDEQETQEDETPSVASDAEDDADGVE